MNIPTLGDLNAHAVAGALLSLQGGNAGEDRPFRPPQWANDYPCKVYIQDVTNNAFYFFDAILRADHDLVARITEHPTQNGANISDHAYDLPEVLALEIGVSDSMDSYQAGQFSDQPSRSVSAYQALKKLKSQHLPLTVQTRLNLYRNMVIEQLRKNDDYRTANSMKALVVFKQIITAELTTAQVSARPQATGQTPKGPVQPATPNGSVASKISRLIRSH